MPAVLDRTLEFHQIVASRRGTQQPPATARPPIRRSEFATAASAIGADIHRTMSKLSKLTQLAQSRSLFDDPMAEINELTHIVKQDITALNSTLAKLQGALAGANSAAAGKQRTAHSTSVVDALKAQLLEATRDFQETLQQRSHNMQLMQKRREEFSAPVDLFSPPDPKGSSSAPGSASAASGAPMPADSGGGFGGESTQLRKRFAPPAPIFELCAPPTPDEGGGGAGGSFAAGGFGGFGGGGSGGFGGGGRHALYKKTDDPPVSAAWASPAAKPAGMTSGADGAVVIDMTSIGAMQQQQMAYAPMGGAYLDARAQVYARGRARACCASWAGREGPGGHRSMCA